MVQKRIFNATTYVLDNIALNDSYFKLKVKVDEKIFKKALPGHFAHVLCSKEILTRKNRTFADYGELKNYFRSSFNELKQSHLLMRRPLSIHNAYKEKGGAKVSCVFEFLIRIKGSGTSQLKKLARGDALEMLVPIGSAFSYKKSIEKMKNIIITAGGMGIAPLFFLSRRLIENNVYPTFLLGMEEEFSLTRTSTMKDALKRISSSYVITSNSIHYEGYKNGFVTEVLAAQLDKMNREELDETDVYTCGPYPMLKKVKEITEEYKVNCEISLEERMGCGIGACMACVCKTKKGNDFKYKRVCVDGPVFNSKEIIFDEENQSIS